jgi:hypothetical protein
MSLSKREYELIERKKEIAMNIAIESGAIERCPIHHECTIFTGDDDVAYKLGNSIFSSNELQGIFDDRREMTYMIKEVIDESAFSCPQCEIDLESD